MVQGKFLEQASFLSVQTSMICCPMTYALVDTEYLRGLFFLSAVQLDEIEGCQCRFGHNICQRTLRIPRVEF